MNYFSDCVQLGLQEVPTEISLLINIAGCGQKCKGCHSPEFQYADNGTLLTKELFQDLLEKYKEKASCICFMNGYQYNEVIDLLTIAKNVGFKTCIYAGADSIFHIKNEVIGLLDYIKIGSYKKELGGLDSPTTNQKMYKVNKENNYYMLEDITHKFWRQQ